MIYISGAVTGTTDYKERFSKAASLLRSVGKIPLNPVKVNAQMPKETTYEQYMKLSLAMLDLCDEIYMLDGWDNSNGASLEFNYAKTMNKKIFFESEAAIDGGRCGR